MAKSEKVKEKKPKQRSPNFPVLSLKKAVEFTGQLYDEYKKHGARVNLAHKLWGYTEHGSAASRCVAAVKAFGLIEVLGSGKAKKVNVSDYGERVCGGAPDHKEILKKLALLPSIHLRLWEYYNGNIPTDELLKDYLLWEHKPPFNKLSVSRFISEFRETIIFAKLGSSDIIGEKVDDVKPPAEKPKLEFGNMPENITYFPLPLPLINGAMTALNMPRLMMSEENYKFMLEQLKAYKSQIVRTPEQPDTGNEKKEPKE